MLALQNKKKAFSLLEVLAALAILSTLFIGLLQGQGDNIYIIDTIQKRQLAQQYIQKKLYAIERQEESPSTGSGLFEVSHELSGQKWKLDVVDQEVFGIRLKKVIYTIELSKRGRKSRVQGAIYVE
jgi:prepilin-type N-terminal cleavage/methylation domain-containing protein